MRFSSFGHTMLKRSKKTQFVDEPASKPIVDSPTKVKRTSGLLTDILSQDDEKVKEIHALHEHLDELVQLKGEMEQIRKNLENYDFPRFLGYADTKLFRSGN